MKEHFPGQNPDEQVKALVRPHWLALLGSILLTLLGAVAPVILIAVVGAVGGPSLDGTEQAAIAAVIGTYYVTLITFFFIRWLSIYLDIGIVTDQRIVDIDQRSLFSRNVAELDCKMVQDVSVDRHGILQTVANFGNVIVQTAGERPNFTFRNIPYPEELVDTIQASVSGREQADDGPVNEAAESMHEAAETMKEVAEDMRRDEPSPTQKAATPDAAPPPAPAAPSAEPQPSPGQPTQPAAEDIPHAAGPADDLQDLPREYDT